MDLKKTDITVHIDETLDPPHREEVRHSLCTLPGVIEVHSRAETPHLMVVEYNPYSLKSEDILHAVTCRGLHAELIGL
jgi:hypothetical protein